MNIMNLFFDAMSRAQYFRSFPKTVAYLEKFFKHPDTEESKKLPSKGFQFFRGQAVIGHTLQNLKNFRYGN
jgi:hypothetical protein